MPGTPFDVQIEETEATVAFRMSGDVNRTAQEKLTDAYEASGSGPVVLDFSDVDYINSTGIALIVGLLAKARAADRPVRAFGLTDHYREIFEITRIADFMAIFDDEHDAVMAS
jgi:anti-anti-sigma factor